MNCGENQHQIATTLQNLGIALALAIEDAGSDYASPAYTTFFNDIDYHAYVFSILRNVSTGTVVDQSTSPVLVCPTPAGQMGFQDRSTSERGDMYMRWRQRRKQIALVAYHTRFIFPLRLVLHEQRPIATTSQYLLEDQ